MSEQDNEQKKAVRFADLCLSKPVQSTLDEIGYETPTPIQAKAIPAFLKGRDLIGQAQTGTGKTAAFALPLLSVLEAEAKGPQALVLAPTRELALQVSEAIATYGKKVKGLSATAIYGGADFTRQFRALDKNPAIVVGTPGRVMDHMRRGTLDLSRISHFILDEADEMLRMGFIEDVEWILEHMPEQRQTALFSATMPPRIAAIAKKQLKDPVTIAIKTATATVDTVRQRFVKCAGMKHKLEVLTNLLQSEERDGSIVFTRTRNAASMVAEELLAKGHAAEAIHGDISQSKREKAVSMLKNGRIDILVATDVAARGLDVDRISHVFNFDIPEDAEPYIHRIGRAGRAGRSGEAILLVTRRDFRQLREIEATTRHQMEPMQPPSKEALRHIRQIKLEQKLRSAIETAKLDHERASIQSAIDSLGCDLETLAAALLSLSQNNPRNGQIETKIDTPVEKSPIRRQMRVSNERTPRLDRPERDTREFQDRTRRRDRDEHASNGPIDQYRIEVGHSHRVKPGNIVGAIANEAGLDSQHIGRIDIYDDHSIVDLPQGMPREVLKTLKKSWVAGQQMRITKIQRGGSRAFVKQTF